MEEQIKNTVSKYIKVPAEQINAHTIIDRTAVASSIILHRMYGQLANEGIIVSDYTTVKTFGQLLDSVNGNESTASPSESLQAGALSTDNNNHLPAIGIDIENISAMPQVNDHREDHFYKMNFAPAEIAYCILQTNPYASFAGLFAAKEAIVKADNTYKGRNFNNILIDHLPGGQPVHPGFQLSISHTGETAIAVAVKNIPASAGSPNITVPTRHSSVSTLLSLGAFLLSLLALLLLLFRSC